MALFPTGQPTNVKLLSPEEDLLIFLQSYYPAFNLVELLNDLEQVAAIRGFEWSRVLISLSKGQNLRLEHLFDQETKEQSLSMTRVLMTPANGVGVLRHVELLIPAQLQRQGLAGQLIRPYYQQCRQANIQRLEVQASSTVGGYAWARYGFSATRTTDVHNILSAAESRGVPAAVVAELRQDFYAFCTQNPPATPFPMRSWAELPFARALLAGTTWHGVLDLADARQTFFFEHYLSARHS